MLSVQRQGPHFDSRPWADAAVGLELAVSEWYRGIEPTLTSGARCNLSLWSNEFYLLAAVASFAVAGNADDELVVDVEFHRDSPIEEEVNFAAEVCRESGPPLAAMPPRKMSLDDSASIDRSDLGAALADFRSFLVAQTRLVVGQVAAMASR